MDWSDDERWNEVLEDDYFIEAQMMAHSRQEALDLVGDDRFYRGSDYADFETLGDSSDKDTSDDYNSDKDNSDDDELYRDDYGNHLYIGIDYVTKEEAELLLDKGIDPQDLEYMDDDEIRKTIEDADLDTFDFNFIL